MFGTFAEEQEEPVYGITTPLGSFNPVWAQLAYAVELARKVARAGTLGDRLRYLVARPGWNPPELGGYRAASEVDRASYAKFEIGKPVSLQLYTLVQFVAVLGGTWALLAAQGRLGRGELLGWSLLIVFCLVALGALSERRRIAFPLEAVRLPVAAAAVLLGGALPATPAAIALGVLFVLASGAWLAGLRATFAGPADVARAA
jgi:hypothetical protein